MFSYKNCLILSMLCVLTLVHTQQLQLEDTQKIPAESQTLEVKEPNSVPQIPKQPNPSPSLQQSQHDMLQSQPLPTQPSPYIAEQEYLAYEAGVGSGKNISEIQLTYLRDIGAVKVVKFTNGLSLIIPQKSNCKECCGPKDNICLFCCDPRPVVGAGFLKGAVG